MSTLAFSNLPLKKEVKGRAKTGMQAFTDAMLLVLKVFAQNAGFDAQDVIFTIQGEHIEICAVNIYLKSGDTLSVIEFEKITVFIVIFGLFLRVDETDACW